MAGDWIKMRARLDEDPTVIAVAEELGTPELWVVGAFWKLWTWLDAQSVDGNAPGVTSAWLDRHVQMDGFATAASRHGWLEVAKDGLRVPHFDRHNGESAKKRALGAKRAALHRSARNAESNAPSVTNASPREEKRREEVKNPPTPRKRGKPRWDGAIPLGLRGEDFAAAWEAWRGHREEIGKPMTPRAGDMALKKLEEMGARRAIAAIEHTIAMGWQGIREPDQSGQPRSKQADTKDFIRREVMKHVDHEPRELT